MSYISDMTRVMLEEITMAEMLTEYSHNEIQGDWFGNKARLLIEQIGKDFDYYVDVTEIKKKAADDPMAESVYQNLKERVENLGINGDNLGIKT